MANRENDWKRERRNERKNKAIRQTVFAAFAPDKDDIRETRYN